MTEENLVTNDRRVPKVSAEITVELNWNDPYKTEPSVAKHAFREELQTNINIVIGDLQGTLLKLLGDMVTTHYQKNRPANEQ